MMRSPEQSVPSGEQTLIQSLQRGLRLMEVVGERGRAHAKALASATGIALPTTYHLLRTLVYEGYLVRVDDGSYVLGDQLEQVAVRGRSFRAVPKVRELLRRAGRNFGAPACLGVFDKGEVVVAELVEAQRAPRLGLWPGTTLPGHATAVGKCILANLAPESLGVYLDRHPLEPLTSHSVVDRRYLEYQLSSISDVAAERQEFRYGVACIAAVVRSPTLLGAVGLAFPVERLGRLRARSEALVELAGQIADALGPVDETASVPFSNRRGVAGRASEIPPLVAVQGCG